MIEILPAHHKRFFSEFLRFPFTIHAEDPCWVPPLLRDVKEQFSRKNPFFAHAEVEPFIAQVRGKTVGRIAAIYNTAHMDFSVEKAGFFGLFDSVNETPVARALIERVSEWLKGKGISVMRGPMNFSSNEEWGVLVEGYDRPPMLMMPYNPVYYPALLEACGLTKAKDLFAYIIDVPESLPEKTARVASVAEKQGITVRPVDLGYFQREMSVFKSIYNSAWEKNWGFIPMTDEEMEYTARKLKPLIVPELVLIAELNGEPIGLLMFLPDFNYVLRHLNGRLLPFGIVKAAWYSRRIKDVRLLLLGVKGGFRKRGVEALLIMEGLRALKRNRFERIEFSWVLEDNYAVQRIIDMVHGRLYKRYRIYERTM